MMQAYKASSKKFPDVVRFDETSVDPKADPTKEYIFVKNYSTSRFMENILRSKQSAVPSEEHIEKMRFLKDDKREGYGLRICFEQSGYSDEEFFEAINLYSEAMDREIILVDGDTIIMVGDQQILEELEDYCADNLWLYLEGADHLLEFVEYERRMIENAGSDKRKNEATHIPLVFV